MARREQTPPERLLHVQTHCGWCDLVVEWRGHITLLRDSWKLADGQPFESSFVCPHWRDHHDVLGFLAVGRRGYSENGVVSGHITGEVVFDR